MCGQHCSTLHFMTTLQLFLQVGANQDETNKESLVGIAYSRIRGYGRRLELIGNSIEYDIIVLLSWGCSNTLVDKLSTSNELDFIPGTHYWPQVFTF